MTWPQKRTRWIILGSLIGLLLVGGILLFLWRPGPSIRFTAFHEGQDGKLAAFQIVNDTDEPYSFLVDRPSSPVFSYKVQGPFGWQEPYGGRVASSVWWFTVAPHTVTDFEVPLPHEELSSPFELGIYIERGTVAQVTSRIAPPIFASEPIRFLLEKIQPGSAYPKLTWSDTVQPHTPP